MSKPLTVIAITVGLLASLSGTAWAQAPAGAAPPCNCDAAAPTAAAAKHAINTKGTGGNNGRVTGPTSKPVQPVAPAASSADGWPKKSGHVTLNR